MAKDQQGKRKNRRDLRRNEEPKPQQMEPHELVILGESGQTVIGLEPDVVSHHRQLHNRLGREKGLPKKFGLTAALRGEGVTTVALGLSGVIAADLDVKICVVELNWWWPKLAGLAGGSGRPGLAQVTAGAPFEEALLCTNLDNLFLLPAGDLNGWEPTRLAHSQALGKKLDALSERFDHLILDIPAVLATSDSLPLSNLADQIGMVVRAGVTPATMVQRALDDIKHLPVSCVILNGEKITMPEWLYRIIPEY